MVVHDLGVAGPEALEAAASPRTRADPALVKALARAFRYQRLLDEERYASISEMAVAEQIERGYLGGLLQLTLLTPHIVEAILNCRQPEGLGLPGLMRPLPLSWSEQRTTLAGECQTGCRQVPLLAGQRPGNVLVTSGRRAGAHRVKRRARTTRWLSDKPAMGQ